MGHNPGIAKFNAFRKVHGNQPCPGELCPAHGQSAAPTAPAATEAREEAAEPDKDFDWPDGTNMDGREQNLDAVVRDPDTVSAPVALWRGHISWLAGDLAVREAAVGMLEG